MKLVETNLQTSNFEQIRHSSIPLSSNAPLQYCYPLRRPVVPKIKNFRPFSRATFTKYSWANNWESSVSQNVDLLWQIVSFHVECSVDSVGEWKVKFDQSAKGWMMTEVKGNLVNESSRVYFSLNIYNYWWNFEGSNEKECEITEGENQDSVKGQFWENPKGFPNIRIYVKIVAKIQKLSLLTSARTSKKNRWE